MDDMATIAASTATDVAVGSSTVRATTRIASLDFVRGVVMILMAIDHVRVYSGLPAGGPTPGIFFTRWITHFVAPGFVFLAGTAAYLHGRKLNPAALSWFLFTRGAWLIFLELTVLRVAWTFNFDFAHYMLAGVIWMIGWCMILMAGLVRLPITAIAISGVAIIALHNVSDFFLPQLERIYASGEPNWLLKILYLGGVVRLGRNGPPLFILFVIVPWIGVMMAGYVFGAVMEMPGERRRRICLRLGLALTILFILLRAANIYGDPRPWRTRAAALAEAVHSARIPMPTVLSFLNTTKYPASLLFLLMTLGPMFLLLAFAERLHGRFSNVVVTYGRVPMFYYLLHIPLIHFAACIVSIVREGHVDAWLFANHPVAPGPPPPGYAWPLGLLYGVYAFCVVALYFPCRWYARLRETRRWPLLSYL